jgi:hypothetical protein
MSENMFTKFENETMADLRYMSQPFVKSYKFLTNSWFGLFLVNSVAGCILLNHFSENYTPAHWTYFRREWNNEWDIWGMWHRDHVAGFKIHSGLYGLRFWFHAAILSFAFCMNFYSIPRLLSKQTKSSEDKR